MVYLIVSCWRSLTQLKKRQLGHDSCAVLRKLGVTLR
jgi:hypothetical protein